MKVSYFETGRYRAPASMRARWPMPPGEYTPEEGAQVFDGMGKRVALAEQLGFDWVSLSEHHYSPRILTPSPPVAAAYLAARVSQIKIALLGPIVSHSNPVRLAEEMAMVDAMSNGRLIVGLLRGTSNEAMTYGVNPRESRERTDEGMELILTAWREPHPFSWQGRYFQYRTVSVWPRPSRQPHPPTYALGTSQEAGAFAARHRIGLGVSYGPFDAMGRATGFYRNECARHGWAPSADHIVYRANILLAGTDEAAEKVLRDHPAQAPFSLGEKLAEALLEVDKRNVAGEARAASINRALPINFIGSPDTVVKQIRQCHALTGAGIVDLGFNTPGSSDPGVLMESMDLFGRKVLPFIRDI